MVGCTPVDYLQVRPRLPENNSSLVVGAELEPATSGFQVLRLNHFATLPPVIYIVSMLA